MIAPMKRGPADQSGTADDVRGKVVAGNLPLHLAQHCAAVLAIEFAGPPPRGQEYGIEEMKAAGARLVKYVVHGPDDPASAADLDAWLTSRQGVFFNENTRKSVAAHNAEVEEDIRREEQFAADHGYYQP